MRYGLSTVCGLLILLSVTVGGNAQQEDPRFNVPNKFTGDWVPTRDACASPLRLRVSKREVTLIHGNDKQTFGDVHLCYSCEGGAKYAGIVVWLEPEFNTGTPFVILLNAGEQEGIAVINYNQESDMEAELVERFPINGIDLRECDKNH
jgi:hypothetical protein